VSPNILGPYLRSHLLTKSYQIWYGSTCREEHVCRGSDTPQVRGGGVKLQRPGNFWDLIRVHPQQEKRVAIKFCMVIKLDVRKLFRGLTALPALAKIFDDTNAGV